MEIDPDDLEQRIERAMARVLAERVDGAGPTLSTEEAADYIGVSARTLGSLVASGKVRPVRPSKGTRRFLRETLDSYLRSCIR